MYMQRVSLVLGLGDDMYGNASPLVAQSVVTSCAGVVYGANPITCAQLLRQTLDRQSL